MKNGMIEVLRFIFSIGIIVFHAQQLYGRPIGNENFLLFGGFAIGVEFFFVVSGYFLAKAAVKRREQAFSEGEVGKISFEYVLHKYRSIFPYHFFAFIASFTTVILITKSNFFEMLQKLILAVPDFFLINLSGIVSTDVNDKEWYIAAMLFAILLLYPMLIKNYNLTSYVMIPILSLSLLGIISMTGESFSRVRDWILITYKGQLRGIAEIGCGVICYNLSDFLKSKEFTRFGKRLLFSIEIMIYVLVIFFGNLKMNTSGYYAPFVLLLTIAIAITFSEITLTKKLKGNKICVCLGALSLSLYLNQAYCLELIQTYGTSYSNTEKVIYCTGLSVICGLICKLVVDWIKKKPIHITTNHT